MYFKHGYTSRSAAPRERKAYFAAYRAAHREERNASQRDWYRQYGHTSRLLKRAAHRPDKRTLNALTGSAVMRRVMAKLRANPVMQAMYRELQIADVMAAEQRRGCWQPTGGSP